MLIKNMAILRSLPAEKNYLNMVLAFEDKRVLELLFHSRARHFIKPSHALNKLVKKYRQNKLEKSAVEFESSLQRSS